jgi:hypothetical protein
MLIVRDHKALSIFKPALLVHTWMLLFACGSGLLRMFYPFFKAIKAAQWFLKSGAQHPYWAIGMVAAPLTFIIVEVFTIFR